ncbi:hypothetical protein C8R47DRAFT_1318939 [Mycena vitilis]|nr:hypothetical protein C8R47DRAFT_1318939 [Mycena vitilis]
MPESQVSNVKAHQIRNELRDEENQIGRCKPKEPLEGKKIKTWPEGRLELYPRCFAMGTDIKSYTTLTVDRGDYNDSQEPDLCGKDLSPWDEDRIPEGADWAYLMGRRLESGPVHVAVRGKCLALSAGFHTLVCHLGLEGNINPMSLEDFRTIVDPLRCIPGANADPEKASKMRSFDLPDEFREPGARELEDITVVVLAAIVTPKLAIVISDFNRLTRLHVVSSSCKFSSEDLQPKSNVWKERLWKAFPGGPDWVLERDKALECLDQWREEVLAGGKRKKKCIADVLTDAHGPGGGIGKHLANDLLYEVAIHPDTPSFYLCSDDRLFGRLRAHLPVFMARWVSPEFLKACGGRTNSRNPFAFNTTSHRNFISGYVSVYRRTSVRMSRELYNLYLEEGLFDNEHIIGTPYRKPVDSLMVTFKEVKVRCFEAPNTNRYHVIMAQVPKGWSTRVEDTTFADVSNAGFLTTLGVASFHEQVNNKLDLENAKSLVKRGRPRKVVTGNPGRPRKSITLKRIAILEAEPRVKKRKSCAEEENVDPLGSEILEEGTRRSKRLRTE